MTNAVVERCQTFEDLHTLGIISDWVASYAKSANLVRLSPVQEAVIPLFVRKQQDVAVEACTGSGKTLAFLIPCVEILRRCMSGSPTTCRVGAVCLAPTRELVIQIKSVLDTVLSHVDDQTLFRSLVLTGGHDMQTDIEAVKHAARLTRWVILVATPGRLSGLLDFLQPGKDWILRDLEVLIFDEADRLFTDGVSSEMQLSAILTALPKQRRTGVFSATLTSDMKSLIKAGMRNPTFIRVAVNPSCPRATSDTTSTVSPPSVVHSIPGGLENYFVLLPRIDKVAFLFKFLFSQVLAKKRRQKCIVFLPTCATVNFFYRVFCAVKAANASLGAVHIERLYGKMNQKPRAQACRRFATAPASAGAILFATDIAARGLDFDNIGWILQFDSPTDPSVFVHRIGRTARAGKSGRSLLLVCPPEDACVPFFRRREIALQDLNADNNDVMRRIQHLRLTAVMRLPEFQLPEAVKDGFEEVPHREHPLNVSSSEGHCVELAMDDFVITWKLFRGLLLSDRDYLERASAAFVSFIRAYMEHDLQYLYPMKMLEIGEFATSLGLLRIPRVKEILGRKIAHFVQSCVSPLAVRFSDPQRQLRWEQARLVKQDCVAEIVPQKLTRLKEAKPRRTRSEKRRVKRQRLDKEWDDLALEERLAKKLRKGKITVTEYERLLRGISEVDQTSNEASDDADSVTAGSHLEKPNDTIRWLKGGRRGKKK